ncbi:putative Zn(2)-C6 fungal-type domain-containing protein [Seiridium cardinale]|uniref:Zn(2)-C6 fungal-type domain-containing protein n=1 Tax=Seiridium cardinale TaxID=138064 RepID=A0ABR2YAJ3_9PEZI
MLGATPNTRGDRRRRFAKACDSCRTKKLRCDGVRPICTRCQDRAIACDYADVHKPTTPRQRRSAHPPPQTPGRTPNDQHTGEGVARDGSDLRSHVQFSVDAPAEPAAFNADPSPSETSDERVVPTHPQVSAPRAVDPTNERTATPKDYSINQDTILRETEDTRYFGPSSGVSLMTVSETFGSSQETAQSSTRSSTREGSWSIWTHPTLENVFEKRTFRPLPPWTEAFSLVKEFFDEEYPAFPCFHPPNFMILLGQQYTPGFSSSPAWRVSFNAVLAIAQRRRFERSPSSAEDADAAWGYAANALGAVLDVLMRNTQLLSVQALLSIAWFFKGTPNPQPSFMLAASALRLAHSIGLHKTSRHSSSRNADYDVRARVFWIAFSLDRELCFRTGRPPAQDFNDFQVDYPENFPDDDSETITTANGFKLRICEALSRLAVVQSGVYHKLYSSQVPTTEPNHVAACIQPLDDQLNQWCTSLMPAFNPEQPPKLGEHASLIRLYYSYYSCAIGIHRAHGSDYWTPLKVPAVPVLGSVVTASINKCIKAARSIAEMVESIPISWKSLAWDVSSLNANAAVILSANIMRQPDHAHAGNDLRAIAGTIRLLSLLDEENPRTYVGRIRRVCEELFRVAQISSQPFQRGQDPSFQQRIDRSETVQVTDHDQGGFPPMESTADSARSRRQPVPPTQIQVGEPAMGPDIGIYGFGYDDWAQPTQATLDPFLAQLSSEMLSDGAFMPFF